MDDLPGSDIVTVEGKVVREIDPFDPPKAQFLGILLGIPLAVILGDLSDYLPSVLYSCFAAWIIMSRKGANLAESFSVRKTSVAALALPIAFALILKSGELLLLEGIDLATKGWLSAWSDLFPVPISPELPLWVKIATGAVLAPIVEELFFRGFFQSSLKRMGFGWSIFLPSIVFALAHHPIAMPGAFITAVIAGLLTLNQGSVVPAIVFHSAINLYVVLLGSILRRFSGLVELMLELVIFTMGLLLAFRIRPELSRLSAEIRLAWRDFVKRPTFRENAVRLCRHWTYILLIIEIAVTLGYIVVVTAQATSL